MSQREVLIMLAHTQWCAPCRQKLLNDPAAVFIGRALSSTEKETLAKLTADDFNTPASLARAMGATLDELDAYADHPVARLRHF